MLNNHLPFYYSEDCTFLRDYEGIFILRRAVVTICERVTNQLAGHLYMVCYASEFSLNFWWLLAH